MDLKSKKIFVAGHRGMVGSAVVRALEKEGYGDILTATREELDCTEQAQVRAFFEKHKPKLVVIAAAKVGGIHANNTYPAEFIYENLMIEANLIHAAYQHGVERLIFLGSSCIYPKFANQPMTEDQLLTGVLEPTNEPYAIAKIAGIKLCESYNRQYGCDFRSLMPTNLYGPGDNFHPENSHVIPALIQRFHEAQVEGLPSVRIWGTGNTRREFLHVDDLANAVVFATAWRREHYDDATASQRSHLNVGTGEDISIQGLAQLVQRVVGFKGEIIFDIGKPEGTPRKLLEISAIGRLGWRPAIGLETGLRSTYEWFTQNRASIRT